VKLINVETRRRRHKKRVLNKATNVVMGAFEKANIETASMLILTLKAKAGKYLP